jgi:hypothetical protein
MRVVPARPLAPRPAPSGERSPVLDRRARGRRTTAGTGRGGRSSPFVPPPPWTLPAVLWSFLLSG